MTKSHYNIHEGRECDRPTELPGGITNPSDATLEAAGIYPVIAAVEDVPDGMEVIGHGWDIAGGAATKLPIYGSISDRLAREAQAVQDQAQADARNYRDGLIAVGALSRAVPAIASGDDLKTVCIKAAEAAAAARDGGDMARAQAIADCSIWALAAWGELKDAGVTGARLWRALAAVQ